MGAGSVCALLSGGTVQCWGTDEFGLLGSGFSGSDECNNGIPCSTMPVTVAGITNATAVSAGGTSACVLLPGGTVQCWGYNHVGQLGNGTSTGPEACTGYPCWTTPVTVQ
jgi:alpha-tubulin suppressor-like RCC1 family protein